ncbi:unnamed protein product [Cochlearia groenlandica]
MSEKKTRGKQRIDIKRVEKDEDRMVTFSKRRSGIYTKLTELSILCGAQVGFLVYSGAGKPYTLGSPSLEAVADRFFNGPTRGIENGQGSIVEAHRRVKTEEICKSYNKIVDEIDKEEEAGKMAVAEEESEEEAWLKEEAKEDDEEATRLMEKFEELHNKVCDVVEGRVNV